ncbi:VanZ family protein [Psychromonas algicola]|uniref:VanZ family protein n=1 Tax=Psychromonas algicola TaxID=2555642 RepID=UPI00106803A6|nr:VanZ family protein [Psychromonas sp. RZ5]TEW49816.1 VanZ family protein [Psychromonas sp. RZ5]
MNLLVQWVRKYWILISLFLVITITVLSFTPLLNALASCDKILHFTAYFVLVLPLILRKPRYWFVLLIIYALSSGVIELLQPYANHRTDVMDVLANISGLVCGSVVAFIINYFVTVD